MNREIFLNADGTEKLPLFVIVRFPTGVVYAHQCAGVSCEIRKAEGFLVPIGHADIADRIARFFNAGFKGHSYPPEAKWTAELKSSLRHLVAEVPCFYTSLDDEEEDRREFLKLDEDRFDECTEGWIPVVTPYGPGILVTENCD